MNQVCLPELVRTIAAQLSATYRKVTFCVDVKTTDTVKIDAYQIQQVITYLVSSSFQWDERGAVIIRVHSVALTQPQASLRLNPEFVAGRYVLLRLDIKGIRAERLLAERHSRGLFGLIVDSRTMILATADDVVRQNNGAIDAVTRCGEQTFFMYFPAVRI
jgi:hypothetical protein